MDCLKITFQTLEATPVVSSVPREWLSGSASSRRSTALTIWKSVTTPAFIHKTAPHNSVLINLTTRSPVVYTARRSQRGARPSTRRYFSDRPLSEVSQLGACLQSFRYPPSPLTGGTQSESPPQRDEGSRRHRLNWRPHFAVPMFTVKSHFAVPKLTTTPRSTVTNRCRWNRLLELTSNRHKTKPRFAALEVPAIRELPWSSLWASGVFFLPSTSFFFSAFTGRNCGGGGKDGSEGRRTLRRPRRKEN